MHGMHGSSIYGTWDAMIQRCTNPKTVKFKNYGGRGITVCKEWRNSFKQFYKDMGDRPKGKSLDRIDNDKGYYPDNCRWATGTEQNQNQRMSKKNKTGITGVYKDGISYISYINIHNKRTYLARTRDFFEACCARKSGELIYWN